MFGGPRGYSQRMVAWCGLVAEFILTEFQDWESLGAFGVFRLEEPPFARSGPMTRPPPQPGGDWASGCLGQLARAFGVDPAQLREEFQDHQRLAQGRKNMKPASTATEAWQHVMTRTQNPRGSR